MIFLGLLGDSPRARLESAVIEIRGSEVWDVLARRSAPAPEAVARALAGTSTGLLPPAEQLGYAHKLAGEWIAAEALAVLAEAKVAAQAVELAGCRAFALPGGLTLGDLALSGSRSGLLIVPVDVADSAIADPAACALAAWERWRATRRELPDSGDQAVEIYQPGGDAWRAITEGRNPATLEIDRLPTLEIVRLINREDERVARAVGSQLPQIAAAIDHITERMRRGGRLIYVGAGTSGRIGVLDASEIPPTYGESPDRVVALIAGGERAIQRSLEGVEDDAEAGAQGIAGLNTCADDSVVGIAASGGTPFVLGALREARRRGALTISLACNSPAAIEALADIAIAPLVGPEVITGSTRMKAGTAQKMTLNMLSTVVMVRMGKTFSNLMVDVQTTNTKLRARARRIVAQACGISEEEAGKALGAAGGEVKTAIVARRAGISPEEARRRLEQSGGLVRAALESAGMEPDV